jgi:hypothetical protein
MMRYLNLVEVLDLHLASGELERDAFTNWLQRSVAAS